MIDKFYEKITEGFTTLNVNIIDDVIKKKICQCYNLVFKEKNPEKIFDEEKTLNHFIQDTKKSIVFDPPREIIFKLGMLKGYIKCLTSLMKDRLFSKCVSEKIGTANDELNDIIKTIADNDGINHSELKNKFNELIPENIFNQMINGLIQIGIVQKHTVGNITTYYVTEKYHTYINFERFYKNEDT